jgi:hypothetical protein
MAQLGLENGHCIILGLGFDQSFTVAKIFPGQRFLPQLGPIRESHRKPGDRPPVNGYPRTARLASDKP